MKLYKFTTYDSSIYIKCEDIVAFENTSDDRGSFIYLNGGQVIYVKELTGKIFDILEKNPIVKLETV